MWYRVSYTAARDLTSLTFTGNRGVGRTNQSAGSTLPGVGLTASHMLVWANGTYLGARPTNGSAQNFPVPAGLLNAGDDVMVSVLARNLGQSLDWGNDGQNRQNRGLYSANLGAVAGTPVWKMQGALGFEPEPTPADAERGLYNNGGTSGERAGWHLPVHDDAGWAPASDLRMDQAWHGWFRADFELDVAETDDAFYAVQIDSSRFAAKTDRSRVVIYVNGWNIGIYAGNVGPQTQFTIPKGFLNLNGPNTIALSVTAEVDGAGPDAARIVNLGTQTGGLPHVMIEATGYVLPEPSPEPTTPVPTTPVPTTPTTPPSTTAPPTTPPSTTAPPTTAPPITPPSTTVPPTTRPPQKKFVRTAPYTLSGVHRGINNRDWNTVCQPYSQTERCRTEIWATIVLIEDGQFVRKTGWAFNNLTYLPYMTEASWRGNPLGDRGGTSNGLFTSAGRQWRTECHTPQTGRGGVPQLHHDDGVRGRAAVHRRVRVLPGEQVGVQQHRDVRRPELAVSLPGPEHPAASQTSGDPADLS